MTDGQWVVMKFGGTSVASADNWNRIADLVRQRRIEGLRVLLVHSALAGISNLLARLMDAAVTRDYESTLGEINRRHGDLASALGVDPGETYLPVIEELSDLVAGIALVGEVSPHLHARIMAAGEIAATRIGHACLKQRGLDSQWIDARTLLSSRNLPDRSDRAETLEARCDYEPDSRILDQIAGPRQIVVTQGFIASNKRGHTVLLGRGGSDTSAAYLAAKITARRLEIWTDVPGLFSANPRAVPSAKLLRSVHYEEAQEIASAGGAVLHPRCITPVRKANIPMLIGCTAHPELPGTLVSDRVGEGPGHIKAIACRKPLTLLSIESLDMWQQVGFLAQMFECFRRVGVSVDLVATSESNVTVSIDAASNGAVGEVLDSLQEKLSDLGRVRLIPDCAAISLIGRNVDRIMHQTGPAFAAFADRSIHLVSQSSNGLNLTFVVNATDADQIVKSLHGSIVDPFDGEGVFGPTWASLVANMGGSI